MRKYAFVFIVSALLLLSCSKGGSDASPALRIAVSQEPPTLDAMASTSLISRIIAVGNIYEKLLTMDETGSVKTELAESCFLSEDTHTLSFSIRRGVAFHDGSPLTGEDAVLSMNRWLDLYKAASDIAGGARFYETEDGIAISSDRSLAYLPVLIASSPQSAVIMPAGIIRELEEGKPASVYIGTGPYRIKEWKKGELIELEAYDSYSPYEGKSGAGIRSLIYFFVPDSVTRSLGMLSGTYDFANDVMSEDRALYSKPGSHTEVIEGSESGSIGIVFNKSSGISSDLSFRRAVSLALDRAKFMKSCYGEYGWSVHSDYMEKEQPFSVPDDAPYNGQNTAEAARMLEQSSYSGERVRILTSNSSNMDKLAISLSDDLEKIGVKSELVVLDWASMMARREDSSAWDIMISAYSSVPLPQMKLYLSPSYPGWIDKDDAGLRIMEGMNEASYDEGLEIWRNAQKELWSSLPVIIPGHYTTAYAKRDDIDGMIINNGFFFWNAYRKEKH